MKKITFTANAGLFICLLLLTLIAASASYAADADTESALKKAIFKNPEDPKANLDMGIFYFDKSMYYEAADYLENTKKLAPGTELSAKAEEYLRTIRKTAPPKPWSLNITAGGQYDSNVILNPTGGPLPEGISHKSDWRAVVSLQGRYKFLKDERTEVSAGYSLYQSLHAKLSDFNISDHVFDATATYVLSPVVTLKGMYAFEYVFAGGDGYDAAHSISPSVIISEGKGFTAKLEYRYRTNNYMNTDVFTDNSDRTGHNHLFGVTQNIPLYSFLSARVAYFHDEESTRKDFWDYSGDKVVAGLTAIMPYRTLLNLEGEYYDVRYDGIRPPAEERRKDRTYTVSAYAVKQLTPKYSVTVGQLYTTNKSNVPDFAYNRAITSLFFNARF